MKQMIIRSINLLLIVGILFCYQQYALKRQAVVLAHEKEEQEARALEKEYRKMVEELEGNVAECQYKDGIYEGTGEGYGGDVVVKVSVEEGAIASVDLVSAKGEDTLYLNLALDLLEQIVEAQSAELDGISGATYSSRGILCAAAQALEEADKNE